MDAMKMAAFAVLSALTLMLLRRLKPEIGAVGALAAGALLLAFAFPFLRQVLEALGGLAQHHGNNPCHHPQARNLHQQINLHALPSPNSA